MKRQTKNSDEAIVEGKKYVTLGKEAHVEFEERKSVFIGHAKPVKSEPEAVEFISSIKKEYHDATHNVSAYQLSGGSVARYSDDGEPQGTAGVPVLNVIKLSGADDMAVVVTRYFGGILLGAGGLVRAYSAAAKLAVDEAGIVVFEEYVCLKFSCTYSDYQKIQNELPKFGAIIDGSSFTDSVDLQVAVKANIKDDFENRINELTNGRTSVKEYARRFDAPCGIDAK